MGNKCIFARMRAITKKRLEDFGEQYPDAKPSLKFWYDVIKSNNFHTAQEVIQVFKGADYVGNDRIVFNITRNKYRLIAKFKFHHVFRLFISVFGHPCRIR